MSTTLTKEARTYEDMQHAVGRKRDAIPLFSLVRVKGYAEVGQLVGYSGQSGNIILWEKPPLDTILNRRKKERAFVVYFDACELAPDYEVEARASLTPQTEAKLVTAWTTALTALVEYADGRTRSDDREDYL